jgi:hypothetical protein
VSFDIQPDLKGELIELRTTDAMNIFIALHVGFELAIADLSKSHEITGGCACGETSF